MSDLSLQASSSGTAIGSAPAAAQGGRIACLDGVRGFAACVVVVFHFFYAFTPAPFQDRARTGFGVSDLPLAVLWNGHFAVAIFFALSGFVLAASSPRTVREAPFMISLRYLRLAVPALVSSIIAWAWLAGFPDAGREVQAMTGSRWFRWVYQAPIPPLSQAIWEGGIGVFLTGTTRFNNPLWTMQAEFIGSLLIYGAYGLLRGRQRIFAMAFGLVLFEAVERYYLVAFCGGALLFELRHRIADRALLGWLVCLAGLVLGATYPGHVSGPGIGAQAWSWMGGNALRPLGAILVLWSVLMTPHLRAVFETPLMQRLGELSFPLYLVHVPLIVAPAAFVFARYGPLSLPELAGLFAVTCLATVLCAGIFLVAVERPVLAALKALRLRGRAYLATL